MNKTIIFILLWTLFAFAGQDYNLNRFLFCMNENVTTLKIESNGKLVSTGHAQIDQAIQRHRIVSLEKWLPMADDRDVVDGIALQNIYIANLSEKKTFNALNRIMDDFRLIPEVHSTDMEPVHRLDLNYDFALPNDPYYNNQWYLPRIGADQAWSLWQENLPGDSTVLVGVVDTGVDYLHPDLAHALYINPGEDLNGDGLFTEDDINGVDDDNNGYVDDLRGWDFSNSDSEDNDIRPPNPGNGATLSHGTHVAGIIGATTNNAIGISGISYQSRIIATKHSLDTDLEDGYVRHGYDGIMYCAKMGAKIINCSWGGQGYSLYEKITIENVAKNYNAIVVCAAGNGGDDGIGDNNDLTHHYPSDFDSAYAVAALRSSDQKTGFSNYGEVIDICAPGSSIYSTIHVSAGSYTSWDGTSMASPVVAGALALLKAWFPEKSKNWLLSTLNNSADNIDEENPSYLGFLGAGRVNVYNAIAQKMLPNLSIEYSSFELQNDPDKTTFSPGDTVRLTLLLNNKQYWLDATDVQGIISSANPYIQFIDSLSDFGTILNGDQQYNDQDAFLFKIADDAPFQPISFELNLMANDSSAYPFSENFELSVNVTNHQEGFPISGQSISAPLAAARFDGENKIVAITDAKFITMFEKDGSIVPGFPVEVGATNAAPIIADMDGNGSKEIVVVTLKGQVKILNRDGSPMFIYETGESLYGDADAAVANMDDTADLEVVFGTVRKNIHVVKLDSTELAGFPKAGTQIINLGVALADVTDDGTPEIIFSTFDSKINIWTAAGDTIPGFPKKLATKITRAAVVSKIGQETALIFTTSDNRLLVYNPDGSLRSEYPTAASILTIPALADLTGDQQPEICFGSSDGQLHISTLDGDSLENFPVQLESPIAAEAVFADFNDDDQFELVVGTDGGQIYAINADGSFLEHFPTVLEEAVQAAPTIVDLDSDGDLEIVLSGLNNLYALETYGQKNSNLAWPTYMGNNKRNGLYTGIYTGISEPKQTQVPDRFYLGQNYPNPFNPLTKITYQLTTTAQVELTVFDMLGQKVQTLVNKRQEPGKYIVQFNGAGLASGIYFYKIKSGDFIHVRKMILMK